MFRNSIKGRLIATVMISQLLLAAGLLFIGIYYTHKRLMSSLEGAMQARAMSVAALVRYNENGTGEVYFEGHLLPPSIDPDHPDMYSVWANRTGLVVRSANWPQDLNLTPKGNQRWSTSLAGVPYRGLRVMDVPILDQENGPKFHPQTLDIVYLSPKLLVREQEQEAAIYIATGSMLLLIITVGLAMLGIRRGLHPLQKLAERAALVSSSDWQLRMPEDVELIDELRPVTESMTTMLARLQRSFEQQRNFLANAAHELKTPVAVLKSTMQSLLQRPRSAEEYQAGLEQSLEDLDRLARLLQWMLRLARAEQWAQGALRRDLPTVDITASCAEVVERLRGLAEARRNQIQLASNGPVMFRADPDDLQLVWTNLLENAVRYTPEGETVIVSVTQQNGGPARITFADKGQGIRAADLPHIFERFYRAEPSRARSTGGFGLGLAIAKALVEAYGGNISVESNPGRGTRMTVELPSKTSNQ